jgi:hypothetical protein
MPDEARVHCSMWSDPDILALPSGWPKFLYVFLFTQPDISMCGRLGTDLDYWATVLAAEATPELIREWLDVLAERRFIIADYQVNEILIRARIRRDQVLKNPKLIKPLIRACNALRSGTIRSAVAAELRRCQREGLVDPRNEVQIDELAASMERTSGYSIAPLFPQVDRPSTGPSTSPSDGPVDGHRGSGTRGRSKVLGGSGGELALWGDPGTVAIPDAKLGTNDDPGWVAFWAAYPRKVSIGDAREAWAKAVRGERVRGRPPRPGPADPAVIIKGAQLYAQSRIGQDPTYTVHPATWLNKDRWNDDPAALVGAGLAKADLQHIQAVQMRERYRQEREG